MQKKKLINIYTTTKTIITVTATVTTSIISTAVSPAAVTPASHTLAAGPIRKLQTIQCIQRWSNI